MKIIDEVRDNVRFPKGEDGVKTLKRMNEVHNKSAIWAINRVNICENLDIEILDIGFGGGQNLLNLRDKFKNSKLYGIDYSPTSLDVAKETTKNLKNIYLKIGDVSKKIEFDENKFDIITAFETLYFWENLNVAFSEIKRVLKPDGVFLLHLEGTTKKTLDEWSNGVNLKNKLNENEIYELLKQNGFKKVEIYALDSSEIRTFIAKKQ
ncbi:class I SAM-dependent methyltransferase [Campylobacter corcagiensis]|uniref:Class I SAM-dependent methyltransferase n=1 Tax=Campylobacter corcagiensis TaxID=1448857 RepID=A0A7M1LDX5_9BACT|nr:class I SAM-dependent methyltransferase [Campylobacter corcagiensis]QKF65069.1 SAM-dependent methyltransferase [Campylobacter corcagiensis]QOQ86782.1 class I SAM-dependent methyltransferase [Campylobacter corcagiensis]